MARKKKKVDEQQDLEEALRQEKREDLLGDMEENRNLTGSTTWENVGEERDDVKESQGRRRKAARIKEFDTSEERRSRQEPPYTTRGPITVPRFGSAGSGGLENEPGPEKE